MAGKSTISITFRLDSDGKGFKDLANDAEGLKKVITSTVTEAQQLKGNVINFAALATGIDAAQRSFNQLHAGMKNLADAYAVQEGNERKLEATMRNSMDASDDQIRSIKELCSAQQELGIIGDEVQLAGAQELATYLGLTSSLETLIPVLNDMNAQQYGFNATCESSVTIATMLGKVMNGQVGALSRYGYTFDEVQEKILKFGTEEERAAVLAEVVSASVGGMNEQLAQTDSGKQQQLVNTLGDMKEKLGSLVTGTLPFVTIAAQSTQALASITTLVGGIKTLSTTIYASAKAFAVSTAAFVKNKVATLAAAAAQKVVTAATTVWTGVQKILNLVLTANPIGLIITAIGALVSAVIAAYNNCEGFRQIVDKVWEAIKPLANAIMNGLAKAFEWLVEKCKEAWEWLKNILGLGNKKVEVAVEVTKPKNAPTIDLGDTYKKYENFTPPTTKTPTAKDNSPVWTDNASTLKAITDNIQILTDKLQTASVEEAALINQQIDAWKAKADAIENAGKAAEDNTPLWKEDAATLEDINANIQILTEKLQTATVEEAALINQQIDAWNEKADAIKNAGKASENTALIWKEEANTLKDISTNIQILNNQLETATIEEAALINQQIQAWNAKADAIKNAGKAAEKTAKSTSEGLLESWSATKGIGNSVQSITDALEGNGNAWQKVVSIVDGFIGLYEGVKSIIGVIDLLTAASAAHATAKGVEAAAEGTEAATRATAATTNAAAASATIVANKLEAASWKELAASEYMAAHAYIPFAGYGIAAGFTAAMLATVTAAGIPALAEGGVATGPTLALVGEYAGASGNPEVIAPLDKLRAMLPEPEGGPTDLQFKIKGDDLVAVYNRRINKVKRT